jgi:hypothetical protein
MVHSTVEDVIASFPHPILPTVQGEPDYHTIHSIRKLLRANARSIESHLGGVALIHLGIIVSITAYATVAPVTTSGTPSLHIQNLDNRGTSIGKTNYHGI